MLPLKNSRCIFNLLCAPQVQAALASTGISNPRLDLGATPAVAEAALASIPAGTRILLFYMAPDKQSLYFAALNIPEDEAAAAAAAAAQSAPPAKGGKGAEAAPPPPPATKCIIDVVPLEMPELDRLRGELRDYTRDAEKRIRESVAAAAVTWKPPVPVGFRN